MSILTFINSRRSFLKKIVGIFLTAAAPFPKSRKAFGFGFAKTKTVYNRAKFKGTVVLAKSSLDNALCKLTGNKETNKAWQLVAGEEDVVGIKLNCVAAPNLSPSKELVLSIANGLKEAGVKENNIIIWERSNRELERSGFEINISGKGIRCFGTDALDPPFEEKLEFSGSIGSLFSNIVAKECTALINVGVLKDHDLSGVCAGMKNFYGAIHNPNKYHDKNGDPYIADLCNHRYIKDKLRLTVIDAKKCQYNGGPGFRPSQTVDYNSIIIGFDMVAVDRVAHSIIEDERRKHGMKSLKDAGRHPSFIDTAGRLGLGESDLSKINLIKI
jgi:uncharacterized protein (DUF362 family)